MARPPAAQEREAADRGRCLQTDLVLAYLDLAGRMAMRRREFIAGLGSAAMWPTVGRSQQTAMPVVGFLQSASPGATVDQLAAFQRGLKEVGFVEGQNVGSYINMRMVNMTACRHSPLI
jgi:hypothetical protein